MQSSAKPWQFPGQHLIMTTWFYKPLESVLSIPEYSMRVAAMAVPRTAPDHDHVVLYNLGRSAISKRQCHMSFDIIFLNLTMQLVFNRGCGQKVIVSEF